MGRLGHLDQTLRERILTHPWHERRRLDRILAVLGMECVFRKSSCRVGERGWEDRARKVWEERGSVQKKLKRVRVAWGARLGCRCTIDR
jgi:hypothetical protein